MRLFKPKYKDKRGRKKQSAKWWIEFKDPNGIVQRWGLSTTDQDVAEIISSQLNFLNEWAKKGLSVPDDIIKWVKKQEPKLREKIYKAGLLLAEQTNLTKLLIEQLEDYRSALSINSKDRYVRQTIRRIERIIDGCGFKFWADVDGIKINEYISSRCENGMSRHTGQIYIRCFRQFANWLKKQKRITATPEIESMKFDKAERRAFEYDEWHRLLDATREGPERSKMSGWIRYVLYKLAMETGLRLDELTGLTRTSFNFSNCTVFVPGKDTKGKRGYHRDATQNMTSGTAALVKDLIKDMKPNAKVFHLTPHAPEMLRKDCEAAGIETTNYKGTIVFHSLRHTLATFLVNKGVDIKTVQVIMRHSKIEMTMEYYTHILRGSKAEAISRLRNLEQKLVKEKSA